MNKWNIKLKMLIELDWISFTFGSLDAGDKNVGNGDGAPNTEGTFWVVAVKEKY